MSEREPITWELRLFLADPYKEWVPNKKQELQDALSAIDAVHDALERENAELRQRVAVLDESADSMHETDAWKLGYDEGFASADDWLAQHEDAMAEHGWVRLPVDADGVPIRVGDVLTDDAEFKSEGKVIRLMLEDESWSVGLECGGWTNPSIHEWHHYHEPTVEDVLAEFFEEVGDGLHTINAVDTRVIIAEYAKRLTLAGDAE